MSDTGYRQLAREGLWHNNPATVQLLGLCPLLAVSTSTVNALGLGLATLAVLVASGTLVSLARHWITPTIRLPAFVLIIAALVTVVEMVMQALAFELYLALGIFIPLIVTNCTILGRAEAFASRNTPGLAAGDGFMMGLGFLVALVLLGSLRELVGEGTLFADMDLLLGPQAASWKLSLAGDADGLLLAVLPPGAFIGLGLLVAAKNRVDQSRAR